MIDTRKAEFQVEMKNYCVWQPREKKTRVNTIFVDLWGWYI